MAPPPAEPSPNGDLVVAAARLARDLLEPRAEEVDQAGAVPPGHVRAMAGAGLLGVLGPRTHGGAGLSRAQARRIFEILAGACGSTYFVWVQHHAPVRLLSESPNRDLVDRYLGAMCRGEVLGAVAFAHLRRPGPPAVTAEPDGDGGWVLRGRAPWLTSWGLADVVAVAGLTPADTVVYVLMPATDGHGRRASAPLALAAMEASCTVSLELDSVAVPASEVIREIPLDQWRAADRLATSQPNPASFGLAETCLRRLGEADAALAGSLASQLDSLRSRAYASSDARVAPGELARLRAEALDFALACATALVAAGGGRSMLSSAPAQRLAREALFYLIQAQTAPVRAATLGLVAARLGHGQPSSAAAAAPAAKE